MKLTILGDSSAITQGFFTTCYRLDEHTLVDCGTGAGTQTAAELAALQRVILSHSHLDHCGLLPLLADAVGYLAPGRTLDVYGLPATLEAVHQHLFAPHIWPDYTRIPTPERPYLRLHPMPMNTEQHFPGFSVRYLPVTHSIPAAAVCLTATDGACLVFSGDTTDSLELAQALNHLPRLDVVLIEASLQQHEESLAHIAGHMTPDRLRRFLARVRHRPRVYLTHRRPVAREEADADYRQALQSWQPVFVHAGMQIVL